MQPRVDRDKAVLGTCDPWLLLALVGLTCVGVLMVYSASIASAYRNYGSPYYVIQREIVWVAIGLVSLTVVTRLHYHTWRRIAFPFFAICVAMLLAVLAPHFGHSSHGARRWFSLPAGVTIEPSELVKLASVVYMAAWLTSKGDRVRDFKKVFFPFGIIVGVVAILIIKQPDLGTTIVVSTSMFCVYFIAGADLLPMAGAGAVAVGFAWVFAHNSSYRYDRLTAFMNPWQDPTGKGYHTVQALLALGTGGLFGQGFGTSVQKNVLPAPHTDSILAVIGEEWGLMGTLGVLLLFLIIAYRGMRICVAAPDRFGKLLAAGITCWITFQALLNFAVITSSVPFTGVPLPFISYGGTSFIISMTAMGILLNISRHASGEVFARQSTHHGRRDGGTRLPRVISHPVPASTAGAGGGSHALQPRRAERSRRLASSPSRGGTGRSNPVPQRPHNSGGP